MSTLAGCANCMPDGRGTGQLEDGMKNARGIAQRGEQDAEGRSLQLQLAGSDHDAILVVRLLNGGTSPITVDREMVFLVDVEVKAPDGSEVPLEMVREMERSASQVADWRSRFVQLLPGRTLERRLVLREGFSRFVVLTGSSVTADGEVMHDRMDACELLYRLPEGVRLRDIGEIIVTYNEYRGFREGLLRYTGLDSRTLDLYEGPLKVAIKPGKGPKRVRHFDEKGKNEVSDD
jgi:hypothetical protein